LTVLVDTSVWFAVANFRDHDNERAKRLLATIASPVLTDHILVETWGLLNSRIHRGAAEQFWANVRRGGVRCEKVTEADLETAWSIGGAFPDQDFSLASVCP
jgi:predicted nucleic acid-binding protein